MGGLQGCPRHDTCMGECWWEGRGVACDLKAARAWFTGQLIPDVGCSRRAGGNDAQWPRRTASAPGALELFERRLPRAMLARCLRSARPCRRQRHASEPATRSTMVPSCCPGALRPWACRGSGPLGRLYFSAGGRSAGRWSRDDEEGRLWLERAVRPPGVADVDYRPCRPARVSARVVIC